MQIFIYNTNIKNNYPMIKINEKEVINLIQNLDYYNIKCNKYKKAYFVVNNSQLLLNKIDKKKHLYAYYPLNINNMTLLYSYKDKFYNGEKEFLEYLNEKIYIIPRQLNRVVFNKHII